MKNSKISRPEHRNDGVYFRLKQVTFALEHCVTNVST